MGFINWMAANWQGVLGAISALLMALIAIFMLLPGSEPENTLQKIVDFIAKFSKK